MKYAKTRTVSSDLEKIQNKIENKNILYPNILIPFDKITEENTNSLNESHDQLIKPHRKLDL